MQSTLTDPGQELNLFVMTNSTRPSGMAADESVASCSRMSHGRIPFCYSLTSTGILE